MIKLKNYLLSIYRAIITSIAFYPAIISVGFFLLALVALALENNGLTSYLLENAPFLVINNADIGHENYVFGIKQITEIAVKAMSPGINDPSTAINAIDYLTELLAIRMQLEDKELYKDKKDQLRLLQATVDFEELLYNTLASLRQYCKHDVVIIQKLLLMLKYLSKEKAIQQIYHKTIEKEKNTIMEDAKLFIKNETDLKVLKELASSIF